MNKTKLICNLWSNYLYHFNSTYRPGHMKYNEIFTYYNIIKDEYLWRKID